MFSLFFVQGLPPFFVLGVSLIAIGTVFSELAGVNYNAMLVQVATPKTVGKVSGLGWGLGYIGGIIALVIVIVAYSANWFGLPQENGLPFRIVALGCALWTVIFVIPFIRNVPELPARRESREGQLLRELRRAVPQHQGPLPPLAPDVLVPAGQRRLPRWTRRGLRIRRDHRVGGVRIQLPRGRGLRHRGEPGRRSQHDHRRPVRRPVRCTSGHRVRARRARRLRPCRVPARGQRQDHLLDLRTRALHLRRPGSGVEPITARTRDARRHGGRDLRLVRDDRTHRQPDLVDAVGPCSSPSSPRRCGASSAS